MFFSSWNQLNCIAQRSIADKMSSSQMLRTVSQVWKFILLSYFVLSVLGRISQINYHYYAILVKPYLHHEAPDYSMGKLKVGSRSERTLKTVPHLSKCLSGLKQNGKQEKKLFTVTVLSALAYVANVKNKKCSIIWTNQN